MGGMGTHLHSCSHFAIPTHNVHKCRDLGVFCSFASCFNLKIQAFYQEQSRKSPQVCSVGVSCVTSFCESENRLCALCIGSVLGNTARMQCTGAGTRQALVFCSCVTSLSACERRVTGKLFASESVKNEGWLAGFVWGLASLEGEH